MEKCTRAEARMSKKDAYDIILNNIQENNGKSLIRDIYSAINQVLEKNNKTLSKQGKDSLRRLVNTDMVEEGFLFPYDSNNPGWRITDKGEKYIKNTGENDNLSYWRLIPGKGAEQWEQFYEKNYIAIGWPKLDYRKGDIDTQIKEKYPEGDLNHIKKRFEYFIDKINIGDIVLIYGNNKILNLAKVKSDYYFDEGEDHYKNKRKVDWLLEEPLDAKKFGDDFYNKLSHQYTIIKIHETEYIDIIENKILNKKINQLAEPFSIIFKDMEQAKRMFSYFNDICQILNIENEDDSRYAVTFRDFGQKKGIHINFTNVLVMGTYGLKDSQEIKIQIPLFKEQGIDFGESGDGTFKSFSVEKKVSLFYVPYDLLMDTGSELFSIFMETLNFIKEQKQNYTSSLYRSYNNSKLAWAIFYPEEREQILSTGLNGVNYYWLTSNPREIKFTDKNVGDIIEFYIINQVGDRAGTKKRIQSVIEEIKKNDKLIGYHSAQRIKGVWALLEVKDSVSNDIIKMKIIDKLEKPVDKKQIIENISEELDLYGKTIQRISPNVYNIVEDIFLEEKKNDEIINSTIIKKAKIPEVDFNKELEIADLHFPAGDKERLTEQITLNLRRGKHIILTGPPGTGKSKLAKTICNTYTNNKYKMVTATSDWSTFNTIGGYRPDLDGRLCFDNGVFLSCFKKYNNHPDNKWLILDEINRADIDKAFGPLFSALTGDKITLSFKSRNGKNVILKPQKELNEIIPKDHVYIVPKDWRLIATMNTFDKTSLYEMSYAFMRRFAFIPVSIPHKISPELVREYLDCWEIGNDIYVTQVAELWSIINQVRKIGPAIVEDLYEYLFAGGDFASVIINYVLPQFEGTREQEITSFISDLEELDFISGEGIKIIKEFTDDYFRLGGHTIGS